MRKLLVTAGGAFVLAAVILGLLRGRGILPGRTGYNVLLVTLDTTRADHLACYRDRDALTPALDGLAARGALFEQAFTSCPMTLPAHATILTGLQPPEHGLRVNGTNSLGPGIRTLAEVLAAHGYQTGAFVAAFVLNAKFGLNRGFQVYDDDLGGALAQEVPEPMSLYRPGNLVTDAALAWLERAVARDVRTRPFFCWVHLYDPHYPYFAHLDLADTRFAGISSYDGEIAFMDRQVSRLMAFLQDRRLAEQTLVVAVGDHGEGLEEHGEVEHGYLLNEEALRVPLIVALPGQVAAGQRVSGIVSGADVFPTILDLVGVRSGTVTSGRSLARALRGDPLPSLPSYAETDLPFTQFGWSPLRSVTTERWKYVRTARPELYDRAADPKELHNLAGALPERLTDMATLLGRLEGEMRPGSAPAVALAAGERRRLEALGYVAGADVPPASGPGAAPGPLKDIKDMLPVKHLETRLTRGRARGTLAPEDVLEITRELVSKSPETPSFQNSFGSALLTAGHLDEAVVHLSEALRLRPDFAEAHNNLGNALNLLGRPDEALRHHAEALRIKPDMAEAHVSMGNVLAAQGNLEAALEHYRDAVRLRPDDAAAHCNLANTLARLGKTAPAVGHYRTALRLKPGFALAHYDLAILLSARGKTRAAIAHYREALRLEPGLAAAHYQLGMALAEDGQLDEAISHYEEALRLSPKEAAFADNLAAAYAAAGQFARAITTGRRAIVLARAAGSAALASEIAGRVRLYQRMARRPAVSRGTRSSRLELSRGTGALARRAALTAIAGA